MKVERLEPPPAPPPPPPEYVITMTEDEAVQLFHVLGCVGGIQPERKASDAIWERLQYLLCETRLKTYDTPFERVALVRKTASQD